MDSILKTSDVDPLSLPIFGDYNVIYDRCNSRFQLITMINEEIRENTGSCHFQDEFWRPGQVTENPH